MTETLRGIAASDGVAVAPAYLLVEPDLSFEKKSVADAEAEVARFDKAVAESQAELESNVILPVNNTISNQITNIITIVSTSEDIL